MASGDPSSPDLRAIERAAADWLARRDRGLSAAEQDDYLQWLREDPRHAAATARHEATVRRLQRLAQWQPAGSSEPNADLFARPAAGRWRWVAALGAAAALLVGGVAVWRGGRDGAPPPVAGSLLRHNQKIAFEDGSVAELRDGSRIEQAYSRAERRVRLLGGEVHFTVAKDAGRPFIVEAGGVAVRAVGTAFNVRLDGTSVDVLVTEGRVQVASPAAVAQVAETGALVSAQERTVVSLDAPAAPEVVPVSHEQISEVLAWQAPRFQFFETPLGEAVAEFNRHNAHQLVLGDPKLAARRIGGTFRTDNVEGFVTLLRLTLGLRAEVRGEQATVLLPP